MSSEEKQLLFGEYAAGRISAADKRRLMAAALEDQDLFDAIAEQEELNELTVSLPAAPPQRQIWPLFMTAVATGAVTLGLFLMQRPKPEPPVEMAKAVPAPVEVAAAPPAPTGVAPSAAPARKRPPMPMAAPKVAAEPEAKKMEAAEVATFAVPPPYQILRREPEGPAQMVDGEALLVRYRPEQAGRFALVDAVSGQELAAAMAGAGQPVDLPFTAVRGAMNLEIRRADVALGRMADRAESRAAAPAAARPPAGGAAPRQAPGPVRISLTIR